MSDKAEIRLLLAALYFQSVQGLMREGKTGWAVLVFLIATSLLVPALLELLAFLVRRFGRRR